MEIKISKELESKSYRLLFEYVKNEGVEPAINFAECINNFTSNNGILLKQAIIYGKNDLLALVRRNRDIIKYLREHKEEFKSFNLKNPNILNSLIALKENNSLIDLYLENAKRLEDIGVSQIEFKKFPIIEEDKATIYRKGDGQILVINKNYTDGQILTLKDEITVDRMQYSKYGPILINTIPYTINNEDTTFCLKAQNNEQGYQIRTIEISNFGFNGDKLPTEKELESYEVPLQLIKK